MVIAMSEFKIGDLIKVDLGGSFDRVAKVESIIMGHRFYPDGFIATELGNVSPNRCAHYNSATSCLPDHLKNSKLSVELNNDR